MTVWLKLDPHFSTRYGLGLLPDILSDRDPRPVKDQLEERYAHGGGWRPIKGFRMEKNRTLRFPGDAPFKPSAHCQIGKEQVIFYEYCSLLAVIQPDQSFEVTRVD